MDDSTRQDRRRLLKASAAAPVIATLHPSSAMAMSSAAYACIAEPGDSALTVNIKILSRVERAPDSVPATLFRYQGGYYEEVDDGQWEPYDGDVDGELGPDPDADPDADPPPDVEEGPYYTSMDGTAVAGYDITDPRGPQLLGPKPAYGGDPVSESCLNSLVDALADPI